MDQSIYFVKKEKYREGLRKKRNENGFKLKRLLPLHCQEQNFKSIFPNFYCSIDQSAKIILENDSLVKKLLKEKTSQNSLVLFSNLSATNSQDCIQKLIYELNVHLLFLEIIQLKQSNHNSIEYACEGLANLLYSKINLKEELITLLNNDLINSIIKLQQYNIEKTLIDKNSIIRLIHSILLQIQNMQLQNHVLKPQLIDLFLLNINWLEINIKVCSQNIAFICDNIQGLMELIDEQRLIEIMDNINQLIDEQQFKFAQYMLETICKLQNSSLLSLKFKTIIQNGQCIKLLQKMSGLKNNNELLETHLQMIKVFYDCSFQIMSSIANQMLQELDFIIQQDLDNKIFQIISIILSSLSDSIEITSEQVEKILLNQYRILNQFHFYNLIEETCDVLKNLQNTYMSYPEIKLNEQQQFLLIKLSESKNTEISELSKQILDYNDDCIYI